MRSRCMGLLPRTTLHSDSEHLGRKKNSQLRTNNQQIVSKTIKGSSPNNALSIYNTISPSLSHETVPLRGTFQRLSTPPIFIITAHFTLTHEKNRVKEII